MIITFEKHGANPDGSDRRVSVRGWAIGDNMAIHRLAGYRRGWAISSRDEGLIVVGVGLRPARIFEKVLDQGTVCEVAIALRNGGLADLSSPELRARGLRAIAAVVDEPVSTARLVEARRLARMIREADKEQRFDEIGTEP